MITIKISDEALDDFGEGFRFYESHEAGLGDYFASCLRGDIEGLRLSADIHRMQQRDYRQLLSRVSPHAIYSTLQAEVADIWAVVDCRWNPEWIRERLDQRGS